MADNYMRDSNVKNYFEQWVKSPTRFTGHATDEERFHKFVKTCIGYARNADKDIERVLTTDSLRLSIYEFMKSQGEIAEHIYHDEANRFIWRFADIVKYEATKLE
jgi:hypothetical protein